MSSTPSLLNFVVWAPDYTDEGALERRLAVRPAHLENARRLINQGILREFSTNWISGAQDLTGVGGGLLTPESVNAAAADIKYVGSCLIYEGETIDAVHKIVEEDLYYTADVWDKEKIVILPIALATGLPPVPS